MRVNDRCRFNLLLCALLCDAIGRFHPRSLFFCISIYLGYLLKIKTLIQILVEKFSHARRQPRFISVRNVPCVSLVPSLSQRGKRTKWHLYALPVVEDDCRIILEIVTSEHTVYKVTLTLYGILCNGTEDDE